MREYNKKNNNKVIAVKKAKHDILVFLISFAFWPKIEQINFIEKLFRDGWF